MLFWLTGRAGFIGLKYMPSTCTRMQSWTDTKKPWNSWMCHYADFGLNMCKWRGQAVQVPASGLLHLSLRTVLLPPSPLRVVFLKYCPNIEALLHQYRNFPHIRVGRLSYPYAMHQENLFVELEVNSWLPSPCHPALQHLSSCHVFPRKLLEPISDRRAHLLLDVWLRIHWHWLKVWFRVLQSFASSLARIWSLLPSFLLSQFSFCHTLSPAASAQFLYDNLHHEEYLVDLDLDVWMHRLCIQLNIQIDQNRPVEDIHVWNVLCKMLSSYLLVQHLAVQLK